MTTSKIGSNSSSRLGCNSFGFTFIEVLVTISLLSLGLVLIFKAMIVSLNRIEHLTNRFYASAVLDNRISTIQRMLIVYKALPVDMNVSEKVNIGMRPVEFKQEMAFHEVEDYIDVFELDLSLVWEEQRRPVKLSRSAYLSDFQYQHAHAP
jgi:prepilin-type N-terminal cleavage/methylation domain-containing protein